MILRVTFKDALTPKVINLNSPKYFFPDERAEAKSEAARLLREKGIFGRKFEMEMKR